MPRNLKPNAPSATSARRSMTLSCKCGMSITVTAREDEALPTHRCRTTHRPAAFGKVQTVEK